MSRPMSPEAAASSGGGGAASPSISQQLRFRRLNKPATISETLDGHATPRRTSSFMSDSSFDRSSLRSTTDDLLRPRAVGGEELHEEPDLWHSLPLLFALIPAVGGLFFKRGAVVLTDAILLAFAAIYLNWCLVTPWHWYHSAQTIKLAGPSNNEAIIDPLLAEHVSTTEQQDKEQDDEQDDETDERHTSNEQSDAAFKELRMHELSALTLCFLGPLLGAYVLHIARESMSHFTDDLVSSLHLTLFVLAAELRPLRYCLKMVQARSLHLQRLVREDPHAIPAQHGHGAESQEKRMVELESAVATLKAPPQQPADAVSATTAEAMKKSQATMQSQIDALTRAVRRYEKRATAQTIQNEARLQELESRLRDALSLAAAAANYGQEGGMVGKFLSWAYGMVMAPVKAMWVLVSTPFRLASRYLVRLLLWLGLVEDTRRKRPSQRPKVKSAKASVKR